MKQVQVVAWCDGEHVDQVRATVERTEGFGTPMALDLCEACDAVFEKDLDTVRAWLARGVPAEKSEPSSRRVPPGSRAGIGGRKPQNLSTACNQPECMNQVPPYVAPTRSALGQHLKQKHGLSIKEAGV